MSNEISAVGFREPPKEAIASIRFLGPGLILSAAIVGSGELIATTALGAKAGFALMWVILFACLVKVAVQLEYGRHCISHGKPTFPAWNSGAGLRVYGIHWSVYIGFLYLLTNLVGQGGVLGGAAQVAAYAFPSIRAEAWALAIAVVLALLVFHGRYSPVEAIAILLNLIFVFIIVFCVFAVQKTPYAFSFRDIVGSLSLKIPEGTLPFALAAFGITGVSAGEIFTYPSWCLEKGYAAWTGPRDDSPEWAARAQGWIRVMILDALVSMVVYTLATVAFYILGATVLRPQETLADGSELIVQLSRIFTEVLGDGTMALFMLGAFVVLFSTVFANNAGYSRIWTDLFGVCGFIDAKEGWQRNRSVAIMAWIIPAIWALSYIVVTKPLFLVIVLGISNSVFLLVVAYKAVIYRYRETDRRLTPSHAYDVIFWVSVLAIAFMAWWSIQAKLG